MLADHTILAALRTSWHLQPDGLSPLTGGMNSSTWLVTFRDQRYVAKSVAYTERSQFEGGLAAADHLDHSDIDAGRPRRAIDGSISVPIELGSRPAVLAVLHFVLGRPLDPRDPIDQQWWGDRLGAVHLRLAGFRHPGLPPWHWVHADAAHLGIEPWVRPAVQWAVSALEKLQVTDRLTFGTLHGDPYYGAFLLNPVTGRIGVIDWGSAISGPLMYDVASAVMYAGGVDKAGDLLQAYIATGALSPSEVESALPILLRFRWAVQADYFARRVTKEATPENLEGLHDAHNALLGRLS